MGTTICKEGKVEEEEHNYKNMKCDLFAMIRLNSRLLPIRAYKKLLSTSPFFCFSTKVEVEDRQTEQGSP